MRLYIWQNAYPVKYGSACIYVVAESEAQARELASKAGIAKYGYKPDALSRVPTGMALVTPRIEAVPYAEAYEWEE